MLLLSTATYVQCARKSAQTVKICKSRHRYSRLS